MWRHHKTIVGIHMGEEEMSMAVLHFHEKIELIATHEWSIRRQANEQKLAKYLKDWFKVNHIKVKNAFTSLPAARSMKKTCGFLKTLREEDIQLELSLNQKKYFGGIQELLLFDLIKLNPPKPEEDTQNYDIFAVRLSEMTWRRSILLGAGLRPVAIELDQYALLRLLHFLYPIQLLGNEAALLLDVSQGGRMIFFDRHEILFDTPNEQNSYSNILRNFSAQFPHCILKNIYVFGDKERKSFDIGVFPVPTIVVDISEKISIAPKCQKPSLPLTPIGLALRGYYD